MTFDEFAQKEHARRVDHFVNYCVTEGREPELEDAVEIFGFCERDAQPIVDEAQEKVDILMGRWIG